MDASHPEDFRGTYDFGGGIFPHKSWRVFDMNFIRVTAVSLVAMAFITASIPGRTATDGNKEAPALTAPDFDLQNLSGAHVTLNQFKGQKPVLLYFWATWCHFCVAVRPEVIKLRKDTPDGDLGILAIDVGAGDSLAKVKRFEEADPAPYTVLYDPDSKVTRSYKVEGVPHFVLLDKNGEVKYQGNQLPSNLMSLLRGGGANQAK
jgi:thiol-disulfide isomerase/thioredoxin